MDLKAGAFRVRMEMTSSGENFSKFFIKGLCEHKEI